MMTLHHRGMLAKLQFFYYHKGIHTEMNTRLQHSKLYRQSARFDLMAASSIEAAFLFSLGSAFQHNMIAEHRAPHLAFSLGSVLWINGRPVSCGLW